MILFVFEGEKTEPLLYSSMKKLFLPKENVDIICSYKSNIYSLYEKMTHNGYFDDVRTDVSLVPLLQEHIKAQGDFEHPLLKIKNRDEVSQIFLFFDYDCQNKTTNGCYCLKENNERIRDLLEFFDDETSSGKLYINYPMIESIRYTKKLPDLKFNCYTVALDECPDKVFKNKVHRFSFYKNFDFLTLSFLYKVQAAFKLPDVKLRKTKLRSFWKRRNEIKRNWKLLVRQNVEKLFNITNSDPETIANHFAITQRSLFDFQLQNFVSNGEVSIICSIPLFLYDYIPASQW